jgi:ATP-dependent protease ClpP protease subunit
LTVGVVAGKITRVTRIWEWSAMRVRRAAVWGISLVVGLAASAGAILAFNTTLDKFSLSNALLICLAFASLTFIWLDYFLKTQYLRS